MAVADWADCEHDQYVDSPHHDLCSNGCGAWVLFTPYNERENEEASPFEVSYYPIEEEP